MRPENTEPIHGETPKGAKMTGWPNCATPDCENKSCLSLNSPYCYPCTRLRDGLSWAEVSTEIAENVKETK